MCTMHIPVIAEYRDRIVINSYKENFPATALKKCEIHVTSIKKLAWPLGIVIRPTELVTT